MIAILDYGAGNLRSVELALRRLGVPSVITRQERDLAAATGLILPGVGAFRDAMTALRGSGLIEPLLREVAQGKPLLGICLGMQLLFEGSEEGPGVPGLGLIPGDVRRLPAQTGGRSYKIPHIGWNVLAPDRSDPLCAGLPDEPYVYFVHSFACHAARREDVLATCAYSETFDAAVRRGNIVGMQFHPEKSGEVGETLLQNFVRLTERGLC